jgi:ribonuclease BN (tRNA processing enzyme)
VSVRLATAFAAALALAVPFAPAAAGSAPAETVSVILLGTGMPFPNHAAQGPATAVTVGSRLFLFDAGPGVERQMEAAGLPVRRGPVTAAFLTHLHSDHTLGLPDLIFTSWVMGRRDPLRLTGPPGTRHMVDRILDAWSEDIDLRTHGLEHDPPGGWRVDVRETTGGLVYDSAGVRIRAFPVPHGSWHWAFGYRIDAPGRRIVISGDTAPSDSVLAEATGVDVLVHEVYPEVKLVPENRPGGDDWPRYMRAFHTSDRELGALAARARPKLLVLTHLVRMGGTDAELLAGIRAGGWDGPVVVGRDLDRY